MKSEDYSKKENEENKIKKRELENILSSHVSRIEPTLDNRSPNVQIDYWTFKRDLVKRILIFKTTYKYAELLEVCEDKIEELVLMHDINISPINKEKNIYRVKKSNSKKNITRSLQLNIKNAYKELDEAGGEEFVEYLKKTFVLMFDRSNKQIIPFVYNPESSNEPGLEYIDWLDK